MVRPGQAIRCRVAVGHDTHRATNGTRCARACAASALHVDAGEPVRSRRLRRRVEWLQVCIEVGLLMLRVELRCASTLVYAYVSQYTGRVMPHDLSFVKILDTVRIKIYRAVL